MELSKKNFIVIFALIVILGAFLRVYKLSTLSFTADEFLGVNTAYGHLKTGEWKRWDFNLDKVAEDKAYAHTLFDFSSEEGAASGAYTRAWIYNWQVSKALNVLSPKVESSFRIVSVLWGIISLLVIYFVAEKFTKKRTIGLIAAFLFAVSISGIIFDRTVRMYSMFFPVYLIMSWLFWEFLESEKGMKYEIIEKLKKITGLNFIYAVPLAFVTLLAFHLHLLASNIILVAVVYFLSCGHNERVRTTKIMNRYSVYFLSVAGVFILAFILLPQYVSPFLSSFTITNHYSYIVKIFSDYNNGILAFALIVLGALYLIKERLKEGIFLTASFFVPAIAAIFLWDRNAGDQYIFFVKSFQIILIASGVYYIAQYLSDHFSEYRQRAFIAVIAVLMILLPDYAYFFEENNVYRQNSRSTDPNYKKVFAYYMKNKHSGEVLVTRWFRNYYFPGANATLVTFGGERSEKDEKKVNAARLEQIRRENPCGWFIWSSSDDAYITGDAKDYARKNFEQINDIAVRGDITVNYWCDEINAGSS